MSLTYTATSPPHEGEPMGTNEHSILPYNTKYILMRTGIYRFLLTNNPEVNSLRTLIGQVVMKTGYVLMNIDFRMNVDPGDDKQRTSASSPYISLAISSSSCIFHPNPIILRPVFPTQSCKFSLSFVFEFSSVTFSSFKQEMN